ncbi:sigma-70 family RNA polymerase sigma factor [Chitinophaga oryzae]|uniref:Sigma-70 family RNA polymerase sigma factor n=1 Tax=Chitinophaga oryzae TaxID=2725414 RepID=A0AAE6ZIY9_9BACT|nr:sigma-70 family RNA polymerase sigma factor [Chitinophaga oryzae]QJB32269.1 sigma-70 family RNA polymerase sigma factor [Chitinophaga oryzae]QJB38730.1 sigma-70 family RNA polymerase sigma factor [Chitinophaga oryzae]
MDAALSLKQLFQQEFSRMVAVISRRFGLQHIEMAEDIVSETFLVAAETWGLKGIPENPAAWLYAVARQKTLYHFRRNKIYEEKVMPALKAGQAEQDALDFSDQHIRDSQLQMIFAVCDPAIASESQIGLALRVLCGFGIDEIAEAFLTSKETINKRLFRAKEKLRAAGIKLEMPPENMLAARLDNVLHVIYLLFNEGYYSGTQSRVLQKELCLEALRLGLMLAGYEKTNVPATNALIALMCFHASRFEARQNNGTSFVLYEEQDNSRWDQVLIHQGVRYLERSAQGGQLTSYHLEAGIAYRHCQQQDTPEKWQDILRLYDQLLQVNFSPSVALNRAYAVYKVHGAQTAITEAEKIPLTNNHFYFVLLGELYKDIQPEKAAACLRQALSLARSSVEKQQVMRKIALL